MAELPVHEARAQFAAALAAVRVLLDTHYLVWFATDGGPVTPQERALVGDPANEMLISAVSIWELQLKWQRFHALGERKGPADPAAILARYRSERVEVMSLTAAQAAARLHGPIDHADPFDRMLLLQAQETGTRLLTRDRALAGHPLVVQL